MEAQIDRDAIAAMDKAGLPDAAPIAAVSVPPGRRPRRRQQSRRPVRCPRRLAVRRRLGHADRRTSATCRGSTPP